MFQIPAANVKEGKEELQLHLWLQILEKDLEFGCFLYCAVGFT